MYLGGNHRWVPLPLAIYTSTWSTTDDFLPNLSLHNLIMYSCVVLFFSSKLF